jgi:hypothetical protein
MLAVCQDASRLLPKAEREFLGGSVVPAADAPGADEISITELDLAPLQRRNPILSTTAKLVEQAPGGVELKGTQDHDTAVVDNGGAIEMTDGKVV